MRTNLARAVRLLRLRRGWTQRELASRIGVSRELISRVERGDLGALTIRAVDRLAEGLEATVDLQVRWRGEQLDRLLDGAHTALQERTAHLLATFGWVTRAEVSFNHFGDRGRVDLVAYHLGLRALLIVEIKSSIGDVQELLGRLDVKARLGRVIAHDAGMGPVAAIVPALVIADARAARRVVAHNASLFHRFAVRGRHALAWVRRPTANTPTGLLWFAERPTSHEDGLKRGKSATEGPNSHRV